MENIEIENAKKQKIDELNEKISELNELLGIDYEIKGLKNFVSVCESLLKEKDYSKFEVVVLNNLKDINKLNSLMKRITDRLKEKLPIWAWKETKL